MSRKLMGKAKSRLFSQLQVGQPASRLYPLTKEMYKFLATKSHQNRKNHVFCPNALVLFSSSLLYQCKEGTVHFLIFPGCVISGSVSNQDTYQSKTTVGVGSYGTGVLEAKKKFFLTFLTRW